MSNGLQGVQCGLQFRGMHLTACFYMMRSMQIANRVITRDLESLISQAVNTDKANYAVVTGVQIHSWPSPESDEPILEYVEPATAYVNVNGVKHELDLQAMPALTPRQIAILAANSGRDSQVC